MKEMKIGKDQAGRRLDRVIRVYAPSMPAGLVQKSLRTGRIKLNGRKAEANARVEEGDMLTLAVDEEFLAPAKKPDRFLSAFRHHVSVVYEDENILLVDKKPGIICHGDEREKVNTLINHIRAYLYQKGEEPRADLCNRIDRFTGGLVIAAKNPEALKDMDIRIRQGNVRKFYICVIRGRMQEEEGVLRDWLYQNPGEKKVRLSKKPVPGAREAVTAYRTLEYHNGLSLMECELFTGRTHQIRAQFAQAGHPLLGDAQYGQAEANGWGCQTLYAWRVSFAENGGMLDYLAGKTFQVHDVPFVHEYFE